MSTPNTLTETTEVPVTSSGAETTLDGSPSSEEIVAVLERVEAADFVAGKAQASNTLVDIFYAGTDFDAVTDEAQALVAPYAMPGLPGIISVAMSRAATRDEEELDDTLHFSLAEAKRLRLLVSRAIVEAEELDE
jgi:hypothetical protein